MSKSIEVTKSSETGRMLSAELKKAPPYGSASYKGREVWKEFG